MTYRKHLLALALVAACSGEQVPGDAVPSAGAQPSAAQRDADAELADITAYRLDMGKIDRWLAVQRNMARAAAAMSPAEREAFRLEDEAEDSDDMDDMVRRIERNPVMNRAVRDAGLSAREFTMITMSILQSGMAAAVLQMRPNDNQDSLVREMKANIENVRFMQENEAVIRQKQQALQAELKAAGLDGESSDDSGDEASHDDH